MKPIVFTVLAIGIVLAVTPAASTLPAARSAEELLVLMIWGLEPASQGERTNTWEVEQPDGERATISVSGLSDCIFSVSVERRLARTGDMLKVDYAFDFAAVRNYDAWLVNGKDERIITKIEGKDWYDQRVVNKASGRTMLSIKQGSIHAFVASGGSIERQQAAFNEFRINHCKARSP
jgi:hypothetical protein